ncbi:MAG TPA: hypothetical protein VG722_03745, partial [Tepidisphaeraceae bacterium]|nr:hypothetical protein [Tepidisphaeraceae bacterium]
MKSQIKEFVLVLAMACLARGATLYVSPYGDDRNAGTEPHPFATLARARDEIQDHPDERPITVVVNGGTYRQTTTLKLDARDSDTHWQVAPGQTVRIEGGIRVDPEAFAPVKEQPIRNRLPAEARDHVLVADLTALGVKSIEPWPTKFRGAPAAPEL